MSQRVGLGYDIHRLAAGRRLVLGGVAIEHPAGLVGHSDGDVLLHAVADAVLGAAGPRGLRSHFPRRDPRYAGAGSPAPLRPGRGEGPGGGPARAGPDATPAPRAPRA